MNYYINDCFMLCDSTFVCYVTVPLYVCRLQQVAHMHQQLTTAHTELTERLDVLLPIQYLTK